MASQRHARSRRTRMTALATSAVALGGSGIGVALAAPALAHPRPRPVWSRVAACESSGDWHINTGNHFYGGLQFWEPTWKGFGGRLYARRADQATREEQIQVARRVLAVQGPHAWPVCSRHARLTRHNGHATRAPLPRYISYSVRSGDSLSMIAQRHRVRGGWERLWHINRSNVPNPNVLFIGQIIQIPIGG